MYRLRGQRGMEGGEAGNMKKKKKGKKLHGRGVKTKAWEISGKFIQKKWGKKGRAVCTWGGVWSRKNGGGKVTDWEKFKVSSSRGDQNAWGV